MKFYVDTLGYEKLSEIVREIAHENGYFNAWDGAAPRYSLRYLKFNGQEKYSFLQSSEPYGDVPLFSIEQALNWFVSHKIPKWDFVDTETKGFGDLQRPPHRMQRHRHRQHVLHKILVLEDEKDFLKKELEKLHETYSECYNKCAVMAKDKADLKSEIEKLESKVKDLIEANDILSKTNIDLKIGYNSLIEKINWTEKQLTGYTKIPIKEYEKEFNQ